MKLKLDSKMATGPEDVLGQLAHQLYERPGARIVGVVELAHVERTQPAPDTDAESSVKMRITALEVGREEQEHHLREAMRALFLHRTARGTIDEAGEVELSERTVELTGGVLHAVEAARLRAVVRHWGEYARAVTRSNRPPTVTELLHELTAIADGLDTAVYGLVGSGT
jgi:hypothetical protein